MQIALRVWRLRIFDAKNSMKRVPALVARNDQGADVLWGSENSRVRKMGGLSASIILPGANLIVADHSMI